MRTESWVDYKVVGSTVFTVPSLYTDLKPVGMGAFGLVCSAKKRTTGEVPCAIKKIAGYFFVLIT
jgi:p38 MAP kinase